MASFDTPATDTDATDVTRLLEAAADGDPDAVDRLFAVIYDELKRLARTQRRKWDGNHTMNTTSLVHEAYLKLAARDVPEWRDRSHFLAVASRAMRHVLVNYAERRSAAKRGGGQEPVPIDEANPVAPEAADEVLALHEALERLGQLEERHARVVECRFFAGLPVRDTAEALGISPATVKRDWALARAWLKRELAGGFGAGSPAVDARR